MAGRHSWLHFNGSGPDVQGGPTEVEEALRFVGDELRGDLEEPKIFQPRITRIAGMRESA